MLQQLKVTAKTGENNMGGLDYDKLLHYYIKRRDVRYLSLDVRENSRVFQNQTNAGLTLG